MCVYETQMPHAATKSKYGKISKSHILILPQPKGHVMLEKCEHEMNFESKFGYFMTT